MLVKDLIGAELDFYVAKAEGKTDVELRTAQRATNKICIVKAAGGRMFDYTYSPSTQWNVGGPLIHKYGMPLQQITDDIWESEYSYTTDDATVDFKAIYGETPLIAAMRALVASVFGDEVESIKED